MSNRDREDDSQSYQEIGVCREECFTDREFSLPLSKLPSIRQRQAHNIGYEERKQKFAVAQVVNKVTTSRRAKPIVQRQFSASRRVRYNLIPPILPILIGDHPQANNDNRFFAF